MASFSKERDKLSFSNLCNTSTYHQQHQRQQRPPGPCTTYHYAPPHSIHLIHQYDVQDVSSCPCARALRIQFPFLTMPLLLIFILSPCTITNICRTALSLGTSTGTCTKPSRNWQRYIPRTTSLSPLLLAIYSRRMMKQWETS